MCVGVFRAISASVSKCKSRTHASFRLHRFVFYRLSYKSCEVLLEQSLEDLLPNTKSSKGTQQQQPRTKDRSSDSDGMLNPQARGDLGLQLNYAFTQFLVISFARALVFGKVQLTRTSSHCCIQRHLRMTNQSINQSNHCFGFDVCHCDGW